MESTTIIRKLKVYSMKSPRGGAVPNQFGIIVAGDGEYFQSYNSIIAFVPDHAARQRGTKVTLDVSKWDYSVTTGKYRNQFLGETKKETVAKINSGEYVLADLNS